MAINVAAIFSLIILFSVSLKIHGKSEKIRFFLTEYDITTATETDRRTPLGATITEDAEKSIAIQAFGKTFILDLSFYYPKEDSEFVLITKLNNFSDSYFQSGFLLHYGFVRDVKDSYVIGFCSTTDKTFFRGYIFTDEIYCIESYDDKGSLIAYRFKDVIVPGCSKMPDGGDLDCSETQYFTPWKANRPPKKPPKPDYSLFFDKYLEMVIQRAKNKTTAKSNSKAGDKGKSHDVVKPTNREDKSNETQNKGDKEHHKEDRDHEKEDKAHYKEAKYHDKEDKARHKEDKDHDKEEDHHKEEKDHHKEEKDHHKEEKDHHKEGKDHDKEDESSGQEQEDKDDNKNLATNSTDGKIKKKDDIDRESRKKRDNTKPTEKKNKADVKNGSNKNNIHPVVEALRDNLDYQCNVEVVVGPSFRKKFQNSDEKILKDIYTQFTLLNKIFRKVTLKRRGKPLYLSFSISRIVVYQDEVYNPFTEDGNLEYFTKMHRQAREICLTVGLVNQFLLSGQLFDGYIPEGGGGICSPNGNTIVVSHGNDNTPAPMALFFSALVRAVTRALGANDRENDCEEGFYPNPMSVLQEYLLAKEIKPPEEYSIFTACNIKEIGQALDVRACLARIPNSLCGNAILDEGEECDCGPAVFCLTIDPCCEPPHLRVEPKNTPKKGCTLLEEAKCGAKQECCTACEVIKGKHKCFSGHGACDIAMCDGKSAKCPVGVEASNGMICSHFNETVPEPLLCKDGKCEQPLCTGFDLKPCSCAPGTGRDCVYCCVKEGKCRSAGSELKLIEGRDFMLPDGMECIGGTCISGKCSPMTGIQQILNFTVLKRHKFPAVVSSSRSSYAMTNIISSLISFFVLFLF